MATIKLTGLQRDFQVHQGNTLTIDMELFDVSAMPLDMTGYLVASEIRYASTGRVAITATLANGFLSWENQAAGKFKLSIPPAETAKLIFDKTSDTLDLVYDIEVNSNTPFPGVFKPFYGTISLMREQTRLA